MATIRRVTATAYIAPLREGGSLPAIIRADDDALYAVKFVGAGQGEKALIAELIAGEIARKLGFNVPEIVLVELDPAIGHTEPDAEIQDLLHASAGLNLGMTFLPHASTFHPNMLPPPSTAFASQLVWFDAFVTNVDRTPRNVNMLIHNSRIWLIDHGASLYFQHNWQDHLKQSESRFPMIRDHVLLRIADHLQRADIDSKNRLGKDVFTSIVSAVPDAWLAENSAFNSPDAVRSGYVEYLTRRLERTEGFVEEARHARSILL